MRFGGTDLLYGIEATGVEVCGTDLLYAGFFF